MNHENRHAKSHCGSGKDTSRVDSRAVAQVEGSLPVTKTIDTGKGVAGAGGGGSSSGLKE